LGLSLKKNWTFSHGERFVNRCCMPKLPRRLPALRLLPALLALAFFSPVALPAPMNSALPKSSRTYKQRVAVRVAREEVGLRISPPSQITPEVAFLVGSDSVPYSPEKALDVTSGKVPSTNQADDYRFIRYGVLGPQGLDKLGEMFDLDETERPWSTTTNVHVLAPLEEPVVPFMSVAYETDSLDEYDRFGIGGGAKINFTKDVSFSTEVLYFGDHSDYNETLSRETRMLARLEIEF